MLLTEPTRLLSNLDCPDGGAIALSRRNCRLTKKSLGPLTSHANICRISTALNNQVSNNPISKFRKVAQLTSSGSAEFHGDRLSAVN